MLFAIVAAIVAYRRAKDSGRNGLPWALAAAGVFIGTQLVVSLGAGFLMGIGVEFFGWPESIIDDNSYHWPITIVAIIASVFATWLLLRYLDNPVAESPSSEVPPPPPTFGQSM